MKYYSYKYRVILCGTKTAPLPDFFIGHMPLSQG
jgi:hypothetical protein